MERLLWAECGHSMATPVRAVSALNGPCWLRSGLSGSFAAARAFAYGKEAILKRAVVEKVAVSIA